MTQRGFPDIEPTIDRGPSGAFDLPSTVARPSPHRQLDPIVIPPAGRGERRRSRAHDEHRRPRRGSRTPTPASSDETGPSAPLSSGYIAGLDGLRAIAVLAVIGFHAAPDHVPGGFLGVDVFFVVSGFLITTILRRERAQQRWNDLPNFWLRRARRLVPALALLIVIVVPVGRALAPDSTVGIGRQIVGGATFSTNWLEIDAGTDYFAETTRELLRPLWSLAIEEQFYVLWPLGFALLFATGLAARHRVRLVVGLAVASAVAMAVLYRIGDTPDPTRVYYGTDTHAFGLLLGIALAIGHAGTPSRTTWGSLLRFPAALSGLVALLVYLPAESSLTYPFGLLAASMLTLPLIAECTTGRGPFVWVLERRPVTWVGQRSYGLYLWHWPVLLIIDTRMAAQSGTRPWWIGVAGAVALTFAIAAASFRFVEEPIRRHGFRRFAADVGSRLVPARGAMPRLAIGMAGLALVGTGIAVASAPSTTGAERAVAEGLEAQRVQQSKLTTNTTPIVDPSAGPDSDAEPAAPPEPPPQQKDGITADSRAAALASGEGVTIFGDSVVSAAAPALIARYPDAYVDAKPIRTWADAAEFVRAADAQGLLGDFVVLGYGTNGGFQLPGTRDGLIATLEALGPDRFVVIPTIVGISHWVDDYNAALVEIAALHDNVVVADWASTVADRPGLFHADRTHPDLEGIDVYTEIVAVALGQSTART